MLRIVIAEPHERLSAWLEAAIAAAQQFEVVGTALDGQKALEVVSHTHPDVVLVDSDVVMPPQGGLTLVAAIKDAMPASSVVFLSVSAHDQTARSAIAAGATAVLTKDGSSQFPADFI